MKILKYSLLEQGKSFQIVLPHVNNPAFGIQAKPLSVGIDGNDTLCIWCLVDETQLSNDPITIHIVMTGESIDDHQYKNSTYLSTVKHGNLMLHIFYDLG